MTAIGLVHREDEDSKKPELRARARATVEGEMTDLTGENGLGSCEMCKGLEDPDHPHGRCKLKVADRRL
jgi:hypothetical protein